jgi:hypothetical protein
MKQSPYLTERNELLKAKKKLESILTAQVMTSRVLVFVSCSNLLDFYSDRGVQCDGHMRMWRGLRASY